MLGIIAAIVITTAIVSGMVSKVREIRRQSREFKAETKRMMGE